MVLINYIRYEMMKKMIDDGFKDNDDAADYPVLQSLQPINFLFAKLR